MSRPLYLKDFWGQTEAKKQIEMLLGEGRMLNRSIDHTLFYGFPGTGKTTLAHIVANEQGGQMFAINGGSIKTKKDILALLRYLNGLDTADPSTQDSKDVVFIDEIHRLSYELAEELYSVLEDLKMHYVYNNTPYTLKFPKFTLIGATTEVGMIPKPLLDRFINRIALRPYTEDELSQIIINFAAKEDFFIDEETALSIAKRSKNTPRIAINNTRRCITTARFHQIDLDQKTVDLTFDIIGIDRLGLSELDRRYLDLIKEKPKGLNTISQTLMEAKDTVTKMIEPYLCQIGFVEFTSRGRMISSEGKKYLEESIRLA